MNINSDINVLGSLTDLNLITVFLNGNIENLNQSNSHYTFTSIKTVRSVKRFESSIKNTFLNFANKNIDDLITNILKSESISADSLLLLFWNASFNNQLLNYLNEKVFFHALYSGKVAIKQPEVSACLIELKQTEANIKNWSDSTIEVTASKYLTLLKKFNLVEGLVNKTINNIYLNDKMFLLFIYWLVAIETKSNLLESSWLKYSFSEKDIFIERVKNKKYSKYINIYYTGDNLKIEPIINFENIYNEIIQS